MTRLKESDIDQIVYQMRQYNHELMSKTGHALSEIAAHAVGMSRVKGSEVRDHGPIAVIPKVATTQDVIDLFEGNVYASMLERGVEEPTIDAILEDYKVRQEPFLLNIPLFAGMPEALEQISHNHSIFIITSNLSSATRAVLNKHRLRCIEDVIGAEQEKSKVKKIERIRALYPGMPAFYIGDTKGDMLEGRETGAHPIAVTWGWHTEERLIKGDPDYVAHSPQELAEILCHSTKFFRARGYLSIKRE